MSLADRLRFHSVVIEDDAYHIWGCSPVWGNDGRVHVFAARIPIAPNAESHYGFDLWYATAQIAHYRANQPQGPYELIRVVLEPGQFAGQWNSGTMCSPAVSRVGNEVVLLYHSNRATVGNDDRASYHIGMLTTDDPNRGWHDHGLILAGPTIEQLAGWDGPVGPYHTGVDNPALLAHPDGRFYLYYRARWMKHKSMMGENTYAVAIADQLTGPYRHHIERICDNPRFIEDPYVYMDGDEICMLVTDNHRDAGLLLRSRDPLHFDFDRAEPGFHTLVRYIDPARLDQATHYRVPKLERPQLLMRDGRPTHLFAPAGSNINRGKGTCCYLFEIGPHDLDAE